jgi:mannosyltransferase OCH1-like enzyme
MGRQMPEQYREYGEQWKRLNPDCALIDWNDNVLMSLEEELPHIRPVLDDLYLRDKGRNGIELAVQVADVVGYALVQQHGGIYVNCDMQPVRPLPSLPAQAWASYENNEDWRINNAAIGARSPGDAFWTNLLLALPENYFLHQYDEMVMSTGPGFLTEFALTHPGELAVLPMSTFNSKHWKSVLPGDDASAYVTQQRYPSDAIAVHHWGHKRDGRTNTVENATQTS